MKYYHFKHNENLHFIIILILFDLAIDVNFLNYQISLAFNHLNSVLY